MRGILTNPGNITTKIISQSVNDFFDVKIGNAAFLVGRQSCAFFQCETCLGKLMLGRIEY